MANNATSTGLGVLIDSWYNKREEKKDLERQAKNVGAEMDELKQKIQFRMEKAELQKASGALATVSLSEVQHISVADKQAFVKWAVENEKFELLPSSANAAPIRHMLQEENKLPPGIETYPETRLSLRKK